MERVVAKPAQKGSLCDEIFDCNWEELSASLCSDLCVFHKSVQWKLGPCDKYQPSLASRATDDWSKLCRVQVVQVWNSPPLLWLFFSFLLPDCASLKVCMLVEASVVCMHRPRDKKISSVQSCCMVVLPRGTQSWKILPVTSFFSHHFKRWHKMAV